MDDAINIVVVLIVCGAIAIGLFSMLLGKLAEWYYRFLDWRESVKHYAPARAPIMSNTPDRQPQTATDRQTDTATAGDDRTCRALQLDRSKDGLLKILVYNGWGVGDVRAALKGDNAALGAAVQAAKEENEGDVYITPIAGRRTNAKYYPNEPELEYQSP